MTLLGGKLDWSDWIRGLIAGFIGGGASSLTTALGTNLIAPDSFNLQHPAKTLQLMGITFLVNGCVAAGAWLRQNPVPNVITTKTETTAESTGNTIKATQTETKTEPPPVKG